MKFVVAGDWHGNTVAVRRALHFAEKEQADAVWQVGDFGFGWSKTSTGDAFVESVSRAAQAYKIPVYWLDGNHENFDLLEGFGYFDHDGPVEIAPMVFYVPRGTVMGVYGASVLWIGGAFSVDKPYRTPHQSWWPQEEITYSDLEKCFDAGEVDVVLSHDAPHSAFVAALSIAAGGNTSEMEHLVWKNDRSFPGAKPNRDALEAVLVSAKPKLWVHGHYHAAYEADLFNDAKTKVLALDMETEEGALALLDFEPSPVEYERIGLDRQHPGRTISSMVNMTMDDFE